MATKFEASPRPRSRGWRSLFSKPRTPTPEEIAREAATRLGVPVDLVGGTPAGASAPAAAEPADRRRGRLAGWWHDLVSPEPAAARRQRLEAEAAAELGLHDGPAHAAR